MGHHGKRGVVVRGRLGNHGVMVRGCHGERGAIVANMGWSGRADVPGTVLTISQSRWIKEPAV